MPKSLGTRRVYTMKNKDKLSKTKVTWVVLGNNQKEIQDYNETYSLVKNFAVVKFSLWFSRAFL